MKQPKLFSRGYLVGALSAKGKFSWYSQYTEKTDNWPDLDSFEWTDIKDVLIIAENTVGNAASISSSGTTYSSVFFACPTIMAVTNNGGILTYNKVIWANNDSYKGQIMSDKTTVEALTSLENVDRIYLNETNTTNSGSSYVKHRTPITIFFKDGTVKVAILTIDIKWRRVQHYVRFYEFEQNDIVDVVCALDTYSMSIGFAVLRKGGVIDVYNNVGFSDSQNDTVEVTSSNLAKTYNTNIENCKLVGSEAVFNGTSSVLWILDKSNNKVYMFNCNNGVKKEYFDDYYCTIPERKQGDKMGLSTHSLLVSDKGVLKSFSSSYAGGDRYYFNVAEDKRYYQSALMDRENGNFNVNYIYVNSKGQIEYSIRKDNNNSCKNDYTSIQAMFSDLGRYEASGLLTSKTPVNLLDKTSVSGFTVKGIEPANTKRRVAFKVEDKWNKLSAEGALTPLATQEITADSVLEEGNTVAELESITATTGLAGKLIYPAVALYADPEAEVIPTFCMTVNAEIDTTVNVYSYTGYSQEYSLSAGEDVQVVNVVAETETTGEGNVVVTARLKQGGEWTDYMALSDTAMKQASALQLKAVYTVTNTDGSQSAKVKNVTIRYTTSGATVNGVSTDIVTKTQRFTNDLVYAHCYVKHKKLQDAVIDAYCSLRKRPKSKSMYQFGNGTGALNTYKLPDAGINQDTLSVYVDGKAVYDFGYNTETSEITLTADKDTALSASYECGWEMSEWIKMVQGVSQVNDGGGYTTEYSYTVPTHAGYEYTVTAIKYSLVRPEGKVTEETIGVGTGKRQMIELPHFAKKETIVCNGAWSYDYDRKLLTIIAPEGEDIVISYDWIAETPTVYAVSAGWAD